MTKVAKPKQEDWINKKWRPMMAVMYMTVCIFDFIIFPIGFTVVQFWETQASNDAFRQWQPLTLIGAGLFHMAMGAVLGITAWSRGQEKMAGISTTMSSNFPTTYNSNNYMGSTNTMGMQQPTSYIHPAQTFSTPNYSGQVQYSSSGKAMVPQDFPER